MTDLDPDPGSDHTNAHGVKLQRGCRDHKGPKPEKGSG
jgi:hypothetical protein